METNTYFRITTEYYKEKELLPHNTIMVSLMDTSCDRFTIQGNELVLVAVRAKEVYKFESWLKFYC